MSDISICEIDFEKWVMLASSEPNSFEQLRQDKISALIESAPKRHQHRLLCLQWRIDQIREKNKASPMAACIAISGLMWDTFGHLSELLHQAENGLSAPTPSIPENIIPFPAKP